MYLILKKIALVLGISSLLVLEYSKILTILILIITFIINIFFRNFGTILATFIGLLNYFHIGLSGGFVSGILLSLWNPKYINKKSKYFINIAGIILGIACILLISKPDWTQSTVPFKLTWWFDVVLCLLVSSGCAYFVGKTC